MLSLDQLRVLVAIADTGSLAAAGRQLHLTQPTVSHHLVSLEANLGGPAVVRGTTGSRLTDLGLAVLPQARAIGDQVDGIEREGRAFARVGRATLTIGCFASAASTILPGPLAWLRDSHRPFRLLVGEPHEVAAACSHRAYDVAVLVTEPGVESPAPEFMSSRVLMDDPLLMVLPRSHPLTARDSVGVADLVGHAWITPTSDDDPEHGLLIRALAERGHPTTPVIRVDEFEVTKALVAQGLGLALLPRLALAEAEPGLEARPIDDPRFARRLHLAWRSDNPALLPFVERIAEAGAQGR